MTQHQFPTPCPVTLDLENGSGRVAVHAVATDETTVEVSGRHADEVRVEHDGDVVPSAPAHPARLPLRRPVPRRHRARPPGQPARRPGRAAPTSASTARSGSPASAAARATSPSTRSTPRPRSRPARATARVGAVSRGPRPAQRLRLGERRRGLRRPQRHVRLGRRRWSGRPARAPSSAPAPATWRSATASAPSPSRPGAATSPCARPRRSAVGQGRVRRRPRRRPRGLPVWTDISTMTGQVRSDLESAGPPADGAPHLEVLARTMSGDVVLTHV